MLFAEKSALTNDNHEIAVLATDVQHDIKHVDPRWLTCNAVCNHTCLVCLDCLHKITVGKQAYALIPRIVPVTESFTLQNSNA
jgi:hypothetical protein